MLRIQCRFVRLPPIASSSPFCSNHQRHSTTLFLPPFCTNSPNPNSSFALDLVRNSRRLHGCRSHVLPCKASLDGGSPDPDGNDYDENDGDQFLQASLLVSETIRHYNLRKQGFIEEAKWHSSSQIHSFSLLANGAKSDVISIGHAFLRRFQSPTVFLKIACDGDLLLPIIVGEIAIEKLIDSLRDDLHEEWPDQFLFVKNLVRTVGYEVKMVRIIKRVVNTYYARIFLGKPTRKATISVDARPSDAINMANMFKAPIYVSKDIVLKDAIRIVYGTWRGSSAKTVYDVSMDSAAEGPDPLAEELDIVKKLNLALVEERYRDAAMWRDKLSKLRMPRPEY